MIHKRKLGEENRGIDKKKRVHGAIHDYEAAGGAAQESAAEVRGEVGEQQLEIFEG